MPNPELFARLAEPVADRALGREPFVTVPGDLGREFSAFTPIVTTPVMAGVAGRDVATILSWVRKFGMVRWSHGMRGAAIRWSPVDCLMMRLAVVMVEAGIDPKDAAWFVGSAESDQTVTLGAAINFGAIIADTRAPSLVAFHRGGTVKHPDDRVSFHLLDSKETVADLFDRLKRTALRRSFTLIDLRDIVQRVEDGLGVEIFVRDKEESK